jgi:hypothetical protein
MVHRSPLSVVLAASLAPFLMVVVVDQAHELQDSVSVVPLVSETLRV